MKGLHLLPLLGLPMVRPGDDLSAMLIGAMRASSSPVEDGDVLVVCQKVVSKAEGRIARRADVSPSAFAQTVAENTGKDARVVEVILRETTRIVRMDGGHLIVETGPGWICANAGVDESNGVEPADLVLLPLDADASARSIRERVAHDMARRVGVIITDTFGRPWRDGLVEFAVGSAGIAPLLDLRGQSDLNGRQLHHTVVAQIDALAAAAGLLMRKGDGIPAVLIQGYTFETSEAGAATLIRGRQTDLFR